MPRQEDDWKALQRVNGSGGNAYIGKDRLEDLAADPDTDLNLDEPIVYSVNHGVSDGRPRAFIRLKNAPEADE